MFIFTLDIVTHNCPIITAVENLPYDSLFLVPCSAALGGVVVVTSNSLIHIAQTARRVVLPVNGWSSRVSDISLPTLTGEDAQRNLKLEGSRAQFVGNNTLFLFLKDGTVYPIEILAEGRTVSQLSMGAPVAHTTIPSVVKSIESEHLLVGSILGLSVLLKTMKVEEEIPAEDVTMTEAPTTVVDNNDTMDFDDDDGECSVINISPLSL